MFRFANPTYLYLLILIPIFTIVFFWMKKIMRNKLNEFGDFSIIKRFMPDVSNSRRNAKFVFMMIALGLISIVLARPQYGMRNEEIKRSGIEVIIAVDVSNSMLCRDVTPDRLSKSKMIVSKLIEQFDRDRIGLVAFAGNAINLLPVTSDYVSAKMFLDQLNPNTIALQGTNLSEAISKASAGFSDKTNVGRALILITDAEDNEDGALLAVEQAAQKGIRVFVLSVGTSAGGPIPMGNGDFKKDLSGNIVTTKLNEKVGKDIAKAGNGVYLHVDQTDVAQTVLEDEFEKMQKEEFSATMYSEYYEQFIAVALLLFIVIMIEICIMEKKNPLFRGFNLFK